MTLQDERMFMNDFYGDNYCCNNSDEISDATLEELEEAIYFYKIMLRSAIEHKDQSEIALCKKELQEAKIIKRRLLIA